MFFIKISYFQKYPHSINSYDISWGVRIHLIYAPGMVGAFFSYTQQIFDVILV